MEYILGIITTLFPVICIVAILVLLVKKHKG